MNTREQGTAEMNLDATELPSVVLTNQADPSGLPLISVQLANNITVLIDPSHTAPEQVTLTYPTPGTWQTLRTLVGEAATTTIQNRINSVAQESDHSRVRSTDPKSIQIMLASPWIRVFELGQLLWDLHWNPLAHDKSMLALDLVRAQHEARDVTGTKPNPAFVTAAVPAAHHFRAEQIRNRLDAETEGLLARALQAAPELNRFQAEYVRELEAALTLEQIADTLSPVPTKINALLTGTPDWRLSGLGPASTAPNAIQVVPHGAADKAITITVPVKPGGLVERTPAYSSFITDDEGTLTATTTLKYDPTTGNFEGHTYARSKPRPTDTVHLRRTANTKPPQPHLYDQHALQQRAAAYVATCTSHSPLTRAFLNQGDTGEEIEWFLFELGLVGSYLGTTRGGSEVSEAGGNEEMTFTSARLTETELIVGLADEGRSLRITLRRYPTRGQQLALEIGFVHTDGTTSTRTTPAQTSQSPGVPLKFRMFDLPRNTKIARIILKVQS